MPPQGRRLTALAAMLMLPLLATGIGALPAAAAAVHPPQQSQVTLVAAPTGPGLADPLSPPAGVLDPTFDGDGIVTTAFGSATDQAHTIAIQSDSKIVAAGYTWNGSNYDFALARYNTDGSLDTSFGSGGKVTTAFGSAADQAYAIAIQSDGKVVVVGSASNGSNDDFALARYNSDGSLDTSFDSDGKVTTDFGSAADVAYAVAIQSDGKIVVAGSASNGGNDDFALARYNGDGSLDTSFGSGGKTMTAILSATDRARAVGIQSDSKIMAAGYTWNGSNYDFALARYNTDGSLDTSFGSGGKVTTSIGSSSDLAGAMTIQRDGKIVAAGSTFNGSNYDSALARYNTDGSLDASFDSDGKVITPIGSSSDEALAVAIQSDGKIVTAGYASNGSNNDFALARYNSNGSLDASFDADGKVTTAILSSNDYAFAVAIQRDGKIMAAGSTSNGSNDDFALARYQVASTSSQGIANNGSATLEGVTITNHSGASCTLTVTKYPMPPGGAPASSGEMPVYWQISTNCTTYSFDLIFNYTDTEVLFGNGVIESSLQAYRSTNGNDYTAAGGVVNTAANTVTVTGVTQLSWWALGSSTPLAVTLADFSAVQQGDCVLLTWETVSELNNRGFNLYRGASDAGPDRQLNETLIPSQSPGSPGGFIYTWEDCADLTPGVTYFYWVEDVDIHGAATLHGPVSADFTAPTAVEVGGLAASSRHAGPPAWLAALAATLGGAALFMGRRRRTRR